MVLGLKLELPVNARAEGDSNDSNGIPVGKIWYVGDTIDLGKSMAGELYSNILILQILA